MKKKLVFLFDVDNTLLDNDRVTADLKCQLEREFGHERPERYWAIFEELRAELGYADYLGALQRYRAIYPSDSDKNHVRRSASSTHVSIKLAVATSRCCSQST